MIVREPESNFIPCPAGTHHAVCCDVVDLGNVEGPYGIKRKVRIVWEVETLMDDGKPYTVSQRYTASLHEKAQLRRDLESWRGKKFSENERKGFELEKLIGVNALLNVIHQDGNDGKTYANIAAIMPPSRNAPKLTVSPEFVRKQDRDQSKAGQTKREYDSTGDNLRDEIPEPGWDDGIEEEDQAAF